RSVSRGACACGGGRGGAGRGLTQADFEVLEDGKPQQIRSFTFEEIVDKPRAGVATAELLAGGEAPVAEDTKRAQPAAPPPAAPQPAAAADADTPKPMTSDELAGRRLLVLVVENASTQH